MNYSRLIANGIYCDNYTCDESVESCAHTKHVPARTKEKKTKKREKEKMSSHLLKYSPWIAFFFFKYNSHTIVCAQVNRHYGERCLRVHTSLALVWFWVPFNLLHGSFSVLGRALSRLGFIFVNLSLIELIAFYQPKCNLCRSRKHIHIQCKLVAPHVLSSFVHFSFFLLWLCHSVFRSRTFNAFYHSRLEDCCFFANARTYFTFRIE